MATIFSGSLNSNEFYNSLFNAIRLTRVIADNLDGLDDSLANKYRTDGGMYHDQSVFTDMDVLYSRVWDPKDTNVLAPEAVVAPKQETITVNQFRQIGLYTDEYLSKRAWMNPATYDEFRAVVQKQVSETKKVFEQKLVDVYVGAQADEYSTTKSTIKITLPTDDDAEAQNRLQAQEIAKQIADIFVMLKDTTSDYNANRFIKSFNESDFDIVWNSKYYNKILYTDLPSIFHKDNLLKQGHVLPERYFGKTNSVAGTAAGNQRAKMEYFIPVDSTGAFKAAGPKVVHVFPGDILPNDTPLTNKPGNETYADLTAEINGVTRTVKVVTDKAAAYETATDSEVICKIIHKDAIKYLSSFETQTEFWNPKNLTTNRYLTWAFALPVQLKAYPVVSLLANTGA